MSGAWGLLLAALISFVVTSVVAYGAIYLYFAWKARSW